MDTAFSHLSVQFHDACADYRQNWSNAAALADSLESLAENLFRSRDARLRLGEDVETWIDLAQLWKSLTEDSGDVSRETWIPCVSLAKFTRNLVADVAANQVRAFENEPYIRILLHRFTSWSATQDSGSFPATRTLTQALSNIVTSNGALTSELWSTYMALPEDQVVLVRLLASPDPRTIFAASVLILNCIHGSKDRTRVLCTSPIGNRVCVSLLDGMVKLYDAEDATDGARAFDIGYEIFTRIVEAGLVPVLFENMTVEDEVITPHQTTLLKLLDSYLQALRSPIPQSSPNVQSLISREELFPMLSDSFLVLSTFAQIAIRRALAPADAVNASAVLGPKSRVSSTSLDKRVVPETVEVSTSAWFEESPEDSDFEGLDNKSPKSSEFQTVSAESDKSTRPSPKMGEFDVALPSVCEALVLITQCIMTLTLEIPSSAVDVKSHFNNARASEGHGLVENLIGLLRLLDQFLPRINFGKPVQDKRGADEDTFRPVMNIPGFSYLKRDLVRLLGILCNEDRAVQDRLRNCDGIPVLMNLCVVDERNPYLREHAIFTLHNALRGNPESQAVLDAIRPSEPWNRDEASQK